MTDYEEAERIANAIVRVHNKKYEALKKHDTESYKRLFVSEENLELALEEIGYERVFVFDETEPRVKFEGMYALKVESANIYAIEAYTEADDDYKCTVGYMQELCDRG